jgi:hypothetical protein
MAEENRTFKTRIEDLAPLTTEPSEQELREVSGGLTLSGVALGAWGYYGLTAGFGAVTSDSGGTCSSSGDCDQ